MDFSLCADRGKGDKCRDGLTFLMGNNLPVGVEDWLSSSFFDRTEQMVKLFIMKIGANLILKIFGNENKFLTIFNNFLKCLIISANLTHLSKKK